MPGARYKLDIDIDTTYRLGFMPKYQSIVDGETITEPYDLTDATFEFLVRDSQRQTIEDFSDHVSLDDDGVIRFYLDPADTAKFSPHRHYYYTADVTFASGDKKRILEGALYARPSFVGVRRPLEG